MIDWGRGCLPRYSTDSLGCMQPSCILLALCNLGACFLGMVFFINLWSTYLNYRNLLAFGSIPSSAHIGILDSMSFIYNGSTSLHSSRKPVLTHQSSCTVLVYWCHSLLHSWAGSHWLMYARRTASPECTALGLLFHCFALGQLSALEGSIVFSWVRLDIYSLHSSVECTYALLIFFLVHLHSSLLERPHWLSLLATDHG